MGLIVFIFTGGEGCIVTSAGTAMGIGSDIGGSIRLPSFFNGIFGHKATTGKFLPHFGASCAQHRIGNELCIEYTKPHCVL